MKYINILPFFILLFSLTIYSQSGKVLRLNGNNQYMVVNSSSQTNIARNERKTMTVWVKTTSNKISRIIAKRSRYDGKRQRTGGTSGTGYEIFMGSNGKTAANGEGAYSWFYNTSFSTTSYHPISINDGNWHHLAIVIDNKSSQKELLFYVDGQNPIKRSGSFTKNYDFSNLVKLYIGASCNTNYFFDGYLDNIRFYNKNLSQQELVADMNAKNVSNNTNNLIAAWDFENVNNTNVPDVSGNNNNGKLINNPAIVEVDDDKGNDNFNVSTEIYQTKVPVGIGKKNERIIRLKINVDKNVTLTKLTTTIAGSSSVNDIEKVKLFYTQSNDRFKNAVQLSESVPNTSNVVFNINKDINAGNNYFWIAYDITNNATEGNIVDATVENFTLNDKVINLEAPNNGSEGFRTILLESEVLFKPGDAGSASYRIPAIETAQDGSLVTVTDKRKNGSGDLPNDIDLVVRRSTDKGRTWTTAKVIAGEGSNIGSGDPALILDKTNGNLILLYAYDRGLFQSTPYNPIRIRMMKSTDNGITWSTPKDITNQIYGANCNNPTTRKWYGVFVASGRMLQLKNGKIIAAISVRQNSSYKLDNFTIESTDGGNNWRTNTNIVEYEGDEAKIVEKNNGDLLMSIRNKGYRRMNISKDKGISWGSAYTENDITDPNCNGEIIRWTSKIDGASKNRLLHTIPFADSRKNVSVLVSYDEGDSWQNRKVIYSGNSAYSTMTILPDNTVGVYYENGEYGDTYQMHFVRFSGAFLNDTDFTVSDRDTPYAKIVNNHITIPNKQKEPITRVKIVSPINGKTFYDKKIKEQDDSIAIKDLPKGIYIVVYYQKNKITTKKISKL